MIEIIVPPGIGDVSWVYSKILDVAKGKEIGFLPGTQLFPRAGPFIDILPHVQNLGYLDSGYPYEHVSPETDLSKVEMKRFGVLANPYLEGGMKLADFHPHQTTHYHYDIFIDEKDREKAKHFINSLSGRPRIGLYASAYSRQPVASSWSWWDVRDWMILAMKLKQRYHGVSFYVIGAEYDTRSLDLFNYLQELNFNVASGVGKHEIGCTIEVIRGLDYFFSYPSGLGILADVVDTPCLMWYPRWGHDKFLNSYADPVNVENGRHLNMLYSSPDDSLAYFRKHGEKWITQKM